MDNAKITDVIRETTLTELEKMKRQPKKRSWDRDCFRQDQDAEGYFLTEQGKGFAVVAAEVCKLAEKSHLAYDEITGTAAKGVKTARETGELLINSLPEIQKSISLIREIFLASVDQLSWIENINGYSKQFFRITGSILKFPGKFHGLL